MKLLAILNDSFREAVDVRVFYLLVALSVALTLTFASLTFTPRPAREVLDTLEPSLNLAPSVPGPGRDRVYFRLRAAEPLDGAPDHPRSPLRFTILAQFVDRADAERVRQDPAPLEGFLRRNFGRFGDLTALEVTGVRPLPAGDPALPAPAPHQVGFEVTTRPTAATLRVWPCDSTLLFGLLPLSGFWDFLNQAGSANPSLSPPHREAAPALGLQVFVIEELLVNGFGSWGAVLVSICVTAFFVPNMLHKGTLDLLLVKPLRRWRLLVYKYLGGLTFIALNASLAVGGVWLALALRSGIWCHTLLLLVPVLTFGFAVLYAVSVLVSVLTRSPVVSILITCLVWLLLYGVGRAHLYFHDQPGGGRAVAQARGTAEETIAAAVDVLHAVLPRTKDLDALTSDLLAGDLLPGLRGDEPARPPDAPRWGESLAVSCGFIAVMLGLACLRFSTKDY
jgi:ABC-2 family transporter protein